MRVSAERAARAGTTCEPIAAAFEGAVDEAVDAVGQFGELFLDASLRLLDQPGGF